MLGDAIASKRQILRAVLDAQDAAICHSDAPSLRHSSLFLHNFIYTCTQYTHPMDNIHKYKRKQKTPFQVKVEAKKTAGRRMWS